MKSKTHTLYSCKNHFGEDCVVQVQYGSSNTKTGDSVQIWIMPLSWVTEGPSAMSNDKASCMDCIHSKSKNRSCYVRKGFAEYGLMSKVKSLHKHYTNNKVVLRPVDNLLDIEGGKIRGKFVRFGAYGEPVLLGHSVVKGIAELAANFTGYTHQWHIPQYSWSKEYFMASVENELLMEKANSAGFRTFRVRTKTSAFIPTREVVCPASKEAGRRVTCVDCALCKGASSKAKNITIIKH